MPGRPVVDSGHCLLQLDAVQDRLPTCLHFRNDQLYSSLSGVLFSTDNFGSVKQFRMKKCTYCGKEYPDEATQCAIDHQPLASFPPEPQPAAVTPKDEEKIGTVEIFESRSAAEVAAAKLEAHGIECWVKADDAGGMYPSLALASGVRLQVHASDGKRATEILKSEAPLPETFDLGTKIEGTSSGDPNSKFKWAFGQITASIIAGVLLTLLYQWVEKQGTKTYYHYAENGRVEGMWIYQDGHLAEYREDRNLDGEWDHRTYYKNGKAVRAEYDNNFDGKPDEWWTFSDDGMDTLEKDTDFNGVPDEFCTYNERIIQEADMKPNGSKFVTMREIFTNGVLFELWRGGDNNGNFKEVVRYDPFWNPISTNQLPVN